VEDERGHPVAHNPDPFKTEPPLFRSRRRQQRSQLHGDAHTLPLLEEPLLHDRLQEQSRIDKLGPCLRRLFDASLADELQVLSKTVIHHYLGCQEGIFPLCPCERKIPQLDFHPGAFGHRGIGGDKGPVSPCRGNKEHDAYEHEEPMG
jgi:hypothetical protein